MSHTNNTGHTAGLRRFNPYTAYKDSGVEWLGEIPAHWEVKKLAWLTKCLDGRRIPLNSEERGRMQGECPYWGANSIVDYVDKWLFDEELVLLGEDGAPFFDRTKPVAFRVSGKVWVNNHAHVLRPGRYTDAAFLAHMLNCVDYHAFIDGTTRDKLTQGRMNTIQIQCPNVGEQRAIADFLDRETAQIDALVAKKERLIELLQEKRTALITRAVTKGLEPNVPMRDSGIEWLGEVPAHWEVKRLKRVTSIRYGLGEPPRQLANGLPFIRATNVTKGRIVDREMQFVDPKDVPWGRDPVLRSGDIIVVRSGAYTGDSAIITAEYHGAIAGYDMVVRPQRVAAGFLAWTLLSDYVLESQIELECMRAAQPHLNSEELGAILILMPPDSEQRAIAASLCRKTAKINVLIAKIRDAIDYLKELRIALITAAVTGKIDVREEAT